jgi:response regulator RpfG family c-di-GMP phosphodiesterase
MTWYPRRLRGEEIPLGARIVAVAETFDSITSDLPYHPKYTDEAARKEIELWSGRQFDPEIVKIFLSMPDKIWDDLRKDIRKSAERKP